MEDKKLYESNPLYEMAIINPKLCKNLSIQVEVEQRDEGPIPYVHCYHNKERNPKNCSYIRLDIANYSHHHKYNKKLDKEQKKEFIELMNSLITVGFGDDTIKITGYESAVNTWVETFEDGNYSKFKFDDNGKLVMPDYMEL